VRTEGLELRVPTDDDLDELAALAAAGVHAPEEMPFAVPWTDAPPQERARGTIQWHWRQRGEWTPQSWSLIMAVVRDGVVAGVQDIGAKDFRVLREVHTGSWLGRGHQGQGIGTQMRAAGLWLAFAGLGAEFACSGAFEDNPASIAVSRKLGYRDDGIDRYVRRGVPAVTLRFRLDRQAWQDSQPVPADIEGLEPCLPLFGLDV
jgi:RimJ/RimL family protein N-acetyltransferase